MYKELLLVPPTKEQMLERLNQKLETFSKNDPAYDFILEGIKDVEENYTLEMAEIYMAGYNARIKMGHIDEKLCNIIRTKDGYGITSRLPIPKYKKKKFKVRDKRY